MDRIRGSPFGITLIVLCLLAIPFAALQHQDSESAQPPLIVAGVGEPTGNALIAGAAALPGQPPYAFAVPSYMDRHQEAAASMILDFDADDYHNGMSSSLRLQRRSSVDRRSQVAPPLRL